MAFFEYDFKVGMRDVDHANKITNKAILGFFEDIGGLHSDDVGFGLNNVISTRLSWVLLHWKVKVLKRASYGDIVHIKTWARNSNKFYTYRDFEMYSMNGELLVIGTSKWVLINIDKGLTKIEDAIIQKYMPETKSVFDCVEVNKLKEPISYSDNVCEYTVLRSNIDINKHMHNLCYLDLAYETLPLQVYENNTFDNIEIMYKSSALLGQKLKCFYSYSDGYHFITVKSFDESTLHCIVKLQ